MMQIEIKLTAEPALLAVLEKVAVALMEGAEVADAAARITMATHPTLEKTSKASKATTKAAEPEPEPEQDTEPEETEADPAVTIEDVRAELTRLNKAGKKETTKKLLTKHGVERLSDLDPKDYAALYAEAKAAK